MKRGDHAMLLWCKIRQLAVVTVIVGMGASGGALIPGELRGAEGVSSIGTSKIRFVDRQLIERSDEVRLRLHPPRKTNERLLESEHPWESATLNWFTVLQEEDKYRMWYECYDVAGWTSGDDTSFCYAESNDGIHWTKPKLGLVSYQGTRDNNILFRQIGQGSYHSRVHGSCVFVDPTAPPDQRYKCVSQGLFQGIGERPYYVAGMSSPDGLHWTRLTQPICPVFADSQYSACFDSAKREYVLFGRVSGRGGRAIGRVASPRFDQFPPLTSSPVLEVDADQPPDCDLYNPACMPYPDGENLWIMFPSLFRHRADTLDIRLAISRDGVRWTWPERDQPWIALGDPGEYDGGSLYMANGGCLLTGDEWSFYYSASPLKHDEADLPKLTEAKNRRVYSRAVTPRDRLVSISAGEKSGNVVTRPVQFIGRRLIVNARVQPGGRLRVGLQSAEGHPIGGHTVADCQPLTDDHSAWTVTWNGAADIGEWSGRPVRIQFEMQHADLFACQFSEP